VDAILTPEGKFSQLKSVPKAECVLAEKGSGGLRKTSIKESNKNEPQTTVDRRGVWTLFFVENEIQTKI